MIDLLCGLINEVRKFKILIIIFSYLKFHLFLDNVYFERPTEYRKVVTLLMGCTARGTKLKVLAVLKHGQRAHRRLPRNLKMTNTPTGHLNAITTSMYLSDVVKSYSDEFSHENALIFLDNYGGYKNTTFRTAASVNHQNLIFYPHNCQEELSAGKIWIQDFKEHFQFQWNRFMDLGRQGKRGYVLWPGYATVIILI